MCRYVLAEQNVSMTTIEPDPKQAMYGSSQHHIIGYLQELQHYAKPASFDVIILNGVIGWGLNEDKHIEMAVKDMHKALRTSGVIVVGYNEGANCCHQFEPYFKRSTLGPLPHSIDLKTSELHHKYMFFER